MKPHIREGEPSAPGAPGASSPEADLLRALLEPADAERTLERSFAILAAHLPFDWAGFVRREGEGGRLVSAWRRSTEEGFEPDTSTRPELAIAFDLPATVTEGELPLDWGNPLTQHLADQGLRRVLFSPLGREGSVALGLVLGRKTGAAFREGGRTLLASIAGALGASLQAAGRERELTLRIEERNTELRVLYDLSRSIGTTLSFDAMVHLVMNAAHRLIDFDLGAVLVELPGLRDLSLHLARPASPEACTEAQEAVRDAFRRLSGRLPPLEAHPRIVTLDRHEPQAARLPAGSGSRVDVPLLRRGEIVGALVLLARRPGAFPEGRTRLLHTIASQASLTLDRLRTLQEAEDLRVQAIIDSVPNGILMTDTSFRVIFANPAARRTLEVLSPEGQIGAPSVLRDLGGVPIEEIAGPVLVQGSAGYFTEIRIEAPHRIYEVSVSPVVGAGSTLQGIVLVISDVTEARLMQEQLLQTEKLSAIGEMISGVAHELNNPLASVMGYAQLLQSAKTRPEVRRKLEVIYSESQRCQRVVQNLLSFARKHRPEKRLFDVNGAITSVLSLLAYQLRVDGISVRTSLDPSVPGVLGDYHLLQQVFLNVVSNAHQAMRDTGGGGSLDITTLRVPEDAASERSEQVRIEIRDRGPGISPENLKRIFDPFFTTKEPGRGTGLGLSLAYAAVNEHGGRIYARSQLGEGTTFVIELPRAPTLQEHVAARDADAEPPASRGARVLVVEDEAPIAELLVETLGTGGHRVEAVTNGREALDLIERREYDLVISDLKMPHMDGRRLYEEILRINPRLARRILFSTGDVASPETREFLRISGVPVLVKPFDLEDVKREVDRLLLGDAGGE